MSTQINEKFVPEKLPLETTIELPGRSKAEYRFDHLSILTDLSRESQVGLSKLRGNPATWNTVLGNLGGIVVPTSRDISLTSTTWRWLARLATIHRCPIISISSREANPADITRIVEDEFPGSHVSMIHVNLDEVDSSWQPNFESSEDKCASSTRTNDVAWKRTLGQMIALCLGWDYLLFLDDDITSVDDVGSNFSALNLMFALRAMEDNQNIQIMGWPAVEFADHSVVGHACCLVGLPQNVFLGAGTLLVRVTNNMSFFPQGIYNEDLLMMIGTAARTPKPYQALAQVGTTLQAPFDPFSDLRARSEEVGELLGEGLLNLLEDHGGDFCYMMGSHYWKQAISHRKDLIRTVIKKRAGWLLIWNEEDPPLSDDPVVHCMNSALWVHKNITAEDLSAYADKWWRDHQQWRTRLLYIQAHTSKLSNEANIANRLKQPFY